MVVKLQGWVFLLQMGIGMGMLFTQCRVLHVGNYLNPSFGSFPQGTGVFELKVSLLFSIDGVHVIGTCVERGIERVSGRGCEVLRVHFSLSCFAATSLLTTFFVFCKWALNYDLWESHDDQYIHGSPLGWGYPATFHALFWV